MGMNTEKKHNIVIAGCGPGAAEFVTPAVRAAAEAADVLVGAPRLLGLIHNPDAETVPVKADIAAVLEEIDAQFGAGRRVCVLVTGDVGLCSLAAPVLKCFGRAACRLIPGISSVQVAFAKIGVEWRNAQVINAHGNRTEPAGVSLPDGDKIAVLLSKKRTYVIYLEAIRQLSRPLKMFICQNLTLPGEQVKEIDPETEEAQEMNISSQTILLIIGEELLQ